MNLNKGWDREHICDSKSVSTSWGSNLPGVAGHWLWLPPCLVLALLEYLGLTASSINGAEGCSSELQL